MTFFSIYIQKYYLNTLKCIVIYASYNISMIYYYLFKGNIFQINVKVVNLLKKLKIFIYEVIRFGKYFTKIVFVSQIKFWTTPMGHRKFRGRSSVKCTYFKAPKATKEATS